MDLSHDPSNVRTHDEKNITAIKASLRKFGQQKPIVIDDKGTVIAGNGTLESAKSLGWTEIDCVVTELDSLNKTAFAIADNRTAELADWDQTALDLQLQSLAELNMDMSEFDFDIKIDDPSVEANEKDDEVPEVDDSNELGIELGQVWKLGNHRLMCGDSTKKEDVDKLMDGKKADIVFTDPPYGNGDSGKYGRGQLGVRTIKGDKDLSCFVKCIKSIKPDVIMYFLQWRTLKESFDSIPLKIKTVGVWDKKNAGLNGSGGMSEQWEAFCFAGNVRFTKFGGNVFSVSRVHKRRSESPHPHQKPLELLEWLLSYIEDYKIILEPFCGSGSTLIACERTDRQCFGMEIDPHYCNVIIKRWEDYTGKKAERII